MRSLKSLFVSGVNGSHTIDNTPNLKEDYDKVLQFLMAGGFCDRNGEYIKNECSLIKDMSDEQIEFWILSEYKSQTGKSLYQGFIRKILVFIYDNDSRLTKPSWYN